ncbi:hypothetical protein SDC9_142052 [bioreactor metagenome]|uniref:Uncharacterized protein n=1 Tax=bioreactor metagenome TaxID=1076179 RepID=A0A645E248_9ZZZZ
MAIGGRLPIYGLSQAQPFNDRLGPKIKVLLHQGLDRPVFHCSRALGIHQNAYGPGYADRISQLNLAAFSQASRHNVFRRIPGRIGGATIYLGGILAGKAAAAVAAIAAIGIHDDFAAGKAAVSIGPADDETARWVYKHPGILPPVLLRYHRQDDMAQNILPHLLHICIRIMLGGNNHRVHGHRPPILVFYRHLAFSIRSKIG